MAQELKSNLKPNINDTLMHYPETSTTWLQINGRNKNQKLVGRF